MRTNLVALKLIHASEGLSLVSYLCPRKRWTIGYGHTGDDVGPGLTITADQAEGIFLADVESQEALVLSCVTVGINDNQLSALVSFTFNEGVGSLRSSTLLHYVNQGNFEAAALEFDRWNKCDGIVLNGLTKRRAAERNLFVS
jgi:lysozyme